MSYVRNATVCAKSYEQIKKRQLSVSVSSWHKKSAPFYRTEPSHPIPSHRMKVQIQSDKTTWHHRQRNVAIYLLYSSLSKQSNEIQQYVVNRGTEGVEKSLQRHRCHCTPMCAPWTRKNTHGAVTQTHAVTLNKKKRQRKGGAVR